MRDQLLFQQTHHQTAVALRWAALTTSALTATIAVVENGYKQVRGLINFDHLSFRYKRHDLIIFDLIIFDLIIFEPD